MNEGKYSSEFSGPNESRPKYVTEGQASLLAILTVGTMLSVVFIQDVTDKHIKVLEKRIDALEQRLKDFE